MKMKAGKRVFGLVTLIVLAGATSAGEFQVSDKFKAKVEPVLTKSGGELHYFAGPDGMVGIGVNFLNGKQMVVYATPEGTTLFSGVAIDVKSGINLANLDVQKLPPPDYSHVLDRVSGATVQDGRKVTFLTEGDPASQNHYYVFIDPTCGYCHKTYANFLKVLAEGGDLVVHYIPVGILGPKAENLAKEMLAKKGEDGLDILRQLARKQRHLTSPDSVADGEAEFENNMAVFRELGFSGVPAVISKVDGEPLVRGGMITAEALQQELRLAAARQLAAAKE